MQEWESSQNDTTRSFLFAYLLKHLRLTNSCKLRLGGHLLRMPTWPEVLMQATNQTLTFSSKLLSPVTKLSFNSRVLDGEGDCFRFLPLGCFCSASDDMSCCCLRFRTFFAISGEVLPSLIFARICNKSKRLSLDCFINEPFVKMSASWYFVGQ